MATEAPSGVTPLNPGSVIPASSTSASGTPSDVNGQQQVQGAAVSSSTEHLTFERKMGDTELSYFLPSREDGVNDMYLHIGFTAPASLCTPARITAIWALLRLRHPPLASTVLANDWVYDDVRFSYAPPSSPWHALAEAQATLDIRADQSKDVLIDEYLNGERTLGNEKLSCLVLADNGGSVEEEGGEGGERRRYDWMMCVVHYLGDGMALHRFANDFFLLLSGNKSAEELRTWTTEELEGLVKAEWEKRWGSGKDEFLKNTNVLPLPVEDTLPPIKGKFRKAAGQVDFILSQDKSIGGHNFPKRKAPKRHTVVPTISLDEAKTKLILKRCKEKGVSIANVLFALSGMAWSRVCHRENNANKKGLGWEQPLMMYSALNLRPYLLPVANVPDSSFWFVAIGYFNVVLPSFLPTLPSTSSPNQNNTHEGAFSPEFEQTLWHRARSAKRQCALVAKHPLLVSRTREMAVLRGERARTWAREDDEKARGEQSPFPTPAPGVLMTMTGKELRAENKNFDVPPGSAAAGSKPPPSNALLGLSLLGNLDGMYQHASYHSGSDPNAKSGVRMKHLTTGSRQRAGALLLFGYTFVGKLWLCLGYDENAFNVEGGGKRTVEGWWEEVLRGVDEVLVGGQA